MADFFLDFFQDALDPQGPGLSLPAYNRVIYVFSGRVAVNDARLDADEAWHGAEEAAVTASEGQATVWRWELRPSSQPQPPGTRLSKPIETLAHGDGWLMRCDSVAFPAGGCAYTHVHRGPGIRCVHEGSIVIESEGETTRYGVGDPWYESGPEPVFAQADHAVPTRFIRVMILPRDLLGQKSITYVKPEDADKPKVQTYRQYVDAVISV